MKIEELKEIVDSLHNLIQKLRTVEETTDEMKKEIINLVNIYENDFLNTVMKGIKENEWRTKIIYTKRDTW